MDVMSLFGVTAAFAQEVEAQSLEARTPRFRSWALFLQAGLTSSW